MYRIRDQTELHSKLNINYQRQHITRYANRTYNLQKEHPRLKTHTEGGQGGGRAGGGEVNETTRKKSGRHRSEMTGQEYTSDLLLVFFTVHQHSAGHIAAKTRYNVYIAWRGRVAWNTCLNVSCCAPPCRHCRRPARRQTEEPSLSPGKKLTMLTVSPTLKTLERTLKRSLLDFTRVYLDHKSLKKNWFLGNTTVVQTSNTSVLSAKTRDQTHIEI